MRRSIRHLLTIILAWGLCLFDAFPVDEVAVLYWHGLDASHTPVGAPPYDPVDFATQVRWLASRGFECITPDDLLDWIEYDAPLPWRPVMLTFDDGYVTVYDVAYPVLAWLGYCGVNFQVTGKIGGTWGWPVRGYYCNWDQIVRMERDGVILTESHTVSHPNLTTRTPEEVEYELAASRAVIEEGIPSKVCRYFCYPYGGTNPEIMAQASAAGYRGSFGTGTHLRTRRSDPVQKINRIYINPHYGLDQLAGFVGLPLNTPTTVPGPGDLVVDDADPQFSAQGSWLASSSLSGYWGAGYLRAELQDPPATATWNISVAQLGIYEIWMSFPQDDLHSKHARVAVHHALGETQWFIDQATPDQGAWVLLQRCLLGSDPDEKVVLTSGTDGISIADAVFCRMIHPFRLAVTVQSTGTALIAWPSLPGVQYAVFGTGDLLAGWDAIGETVYGHPDRWCSGSYEISGPGSFWRVVAESPEPIVNRWVP